MGQGRFGKEADDMGKTKRRIPYKKLLSDGIKSFEGVFIELADGTLVRTSPVVGFNGFKEIETLNTVYYPV